MYKFDGYVPCFLFSFFWGVNSISFVCFFHSDVCLNELGALMKYGYNWKSFHTSTQPSKHIENINQENFVYLPFNIYLNTHVVSFFLPSRLPALCEAHPKRFFSKYASCVVVLSRSKMNWNHMLIYNTFWSLLYSEILNMNICNSFSLCT